MMPPPSAPLTSDGRGGGDLPIPAQDTLPATLDLPDDHPFIATLEWTDTHQHLWDLDKFNLPCVGLALRLASLVSLVTHPFAQRAS